MEVDPDQPARGADRPQLRVVRLRGDGHRACAAEWEATSGPCSSAATSQKPRSLRCERSTRMPGRRRRARAPAEGGEAGPSSGVPGKAKETPSRTRSAGSRRGPASAARRRAGRRAPRGRRRSARRPRGGARRRRRDRRGRPPCGRPAAGRPPRARCGAAARPGRAPRRGARSRGTGAA
jgi:hypothetical protein